MASSGSPAASTAERRRAAMRVAIAGNPNSGKTTVFNALTGLRLKVGNYPGVTVEKREGALTGTGMAILDLPGTYSLSSRSPDETVARDVLLGHMPGEPKPDAVLVVVDASNLERNLYLTSQILDLGIPVVIVCNMMDVAAARGLKIDCAALSEALGVPVVGTVASRRQGLAEVREALAKLDHSGGDGRRWQLPDAIEQCVNRLRHLIQQGRGVSATVADGVAILWLVDFLSADAHARGAAEAFADSLPGEDGRAMRSAAKQLDDEDTDVMGQIVEARYAWIGGVAERVVRGATGGPADPDATNVSDRIDRVLTHRVFGLAIFGGLMFVLFLSIFSWAEPFMGLIEAGQAALGRGVESVMSAGPLRSLITDGVINGVGSVLVFFPQICILFLCLGILEDSGYMARAAFLMDRVMSRVGLHGRSFIPLLSSYACAIPGILATRTIENRRDRLTTIMVAPLMSCSARLPVYTIVIAAVFGDRTWLKAVILFGLYALGTAAALLMALVFKKTLFAGPQPTFIMELPPYHMPRPWPIVRATWDRSKSFLTRAGTTIFSVCIIVWALSYFPRLDRSNPPPSVAVQLAELDESQTLERANILAAAQLHGSVIGRLGRAIEPVIEPLGFDWRIGIGVLTSFLAREVFVGTMGITFSVGEADETSSALRDQLATATWPDGHVVLSPLVAIGLMVFYVLACQCVSTLAVTRRETGSWRWPALMFGYMTLLAYGATLLVFQIGTRLGLGLP